VNGEFEAVATEEQPLIALPPTVNVNDPRTDAVALRVAAVFTVRDGTVKLEIVEAAGDSVIEIALDVAVE
jgi:hypothetical protein